MDDGMPALSALAALSDPFPDTAISWRIGATNGDKTKGMALAYIDARDVMERLDTVCGPGNWQDRYVETPKGRILCSLSVRIGGEWVEKSDGAGETDVESDKGAISDALKRAAVKWGIGRYLYNIDSPWVDVEVKGKSTVMKPGARKALDKCHHDYVRRSQPQINAGAPDAGQREEPEAQQETGAEDSPPASAPVQQTLSKKDAGPDFKAMTNEIRACKTIEALKTWGAASVKRVGLQPADWQKTLRTEYTDRIEAIKYMADTARDANRVYETEIPQ